jgi:small subunit ribosomal protein S3
VGQKTHPTGFRMGINKAHNATWFANYGAFSEVLKEDYIIRNFFEKNSPQFTVKRGFQN